MNDTDIRKETADLLAGLNKVELLTVQDIVIDLLRGRLSDTDLLQIRESIAAAAVRNIKRSRR